MSWLVLIGLIILVAFVFGSHEHDSTSERINVPSLIGAIIIVGLLLSTCSGCI